MIIEGICSSCKYQVPQVRRFAITLSLLIVITGCSATLPVYDEIIQFDTRDALRENFGEPLNIDYYEYGPDVLSLREQLSGEIPIFRFERWTYASTDNQKSTETGKTIIEIWINKPDSGDFVTSTGWLSNADYQELGRR